MWVPVPPIRVPNLTAKGVGLKSASSVAMRGFFAPIWGAVRLESDGVEVQVRTMAAAGQVLTLGSETLVESS